MKVCYTLDDGLQSQTRFWSELVFPATYFILPETAEAKTCFGDEFKSRCCRWNDVRYLAKTNEIGYHGFSTSYDKWGTEASRKRTEHGMELFELNVGLRPVSFSYTNMVSAQVALISSFFPYIRDYYWRDAIKSEDGNRQFVFRMPRELIPAQARKFEDKIFCRHPIKNVLGEMRRLKEIENEGYEYCVIILHAIDDAIIEVTKITKTIWECITFREIFEGQSIADNSDKPQPVTVIQNTVAVAGASPAVSPIK